jgi:hypothetical protein
MLGLVLLMQQLQCDAFLAQLVVPVVPVGYGPSPAARSRGWFGEEQSIEGCLVEVVRQRPSQAGDFGAAKVVGYGAAGDADTPSDLTVAQSSGPFEAEDFVG